MQTAGARDRSWEPGVPFHRDLVRVRESCGTRCFGTAWPRIIADRWDNATRTLASQVTKYLTTYKQAGGELDHLIQDVSRLSLLLLLPQFRSPQSYHSLRWERRLGLTKSPTQCRFAFGPCHRSARAERAWRSAGRPSRMIRDGRQRWPRCVPGASNQATPPRLATLPQPWASTAHRTLVMLSRFCCCQSR